MIFEVGIDTALAIALSVGIRRDDKDLRPRSEYQFDTTTKQRDLMASSLPALRWTALRFNRPVFQCSHHRCVPCVASQTNLFKAASPKYIRAFETSTRRESSATSGAVTPEFGSSSPLSVLGKSLGQNAKNTKPGFFPKTSEKSVAYWLLGSAASVFGLVVFGGLTRLTESGYSALSYAGWQ